jgi:hypothetical protein
MHSRCYKKLVGFLRFTTHNVAEMELGRDRKTGKVMWLTAMYWHWIVPADIEDPIRQ